MSICILSIGSELLEGSVIDSNSAFIANNLKRWGGKVELIRMVSDNKDEIVSLFQKYSKKFDIILTTGGLGPTFDDITAECLAESAGLSLELNEKAYNHMASCLNRAGVTIRQEHKHQSMLPATCRLFNNNVGTAMGFSVSLNKADIICMPGVPLEMKDMFIKEVLPFIVDKLGLKEQSYIDLHFLSIAESDIDVFIRSLNISNEVQCIINAGKGQVVVKLRGENKELVEDYALKIEKAFPKNFIGRGDILPAEYLVNLLKEKGKTISFAESCTGGMLSEMVTDISGASSVFYGSVVSYDNSIKENVLHVSADILNTFGAVSEECAHAMAEGVKKLMNTDYAISITGIAGPTGGTKDKPVGLVYIGVTDGENTKVYKNIFNGSRQQVRLRSATKALQLIIDFISNK